MDYIYLDLACGCGGMCPTSGLWKYMASGSYRLDWSATVGFSLNSVDKTKGHEKKYKLRIFIN